MPAQPTGSGEWLCGRNLYAVKKETVQREHLIRTVFLLPHRRLSIFILVVNIIFAVILFVVLLRENKVNSLNSYM